MSEKAPDAASLKAELFARAWEVVDRHAFVRSATLAGSFVDAPTLEGISDIDLVVVVDRLDRARMELLQSDFDAALRPTLARHAYDFRINATLGPLKFNAPRLAVLHLMLYARDAHVAHVIHSPFTCLDWQRSPMVRKQTLADVYPVFGLQPRHFLGSRRSASDYLKDLRAGTISYRELVCSDAGYEEQPRGKPMTERDRHEFAYHVMRFLMGNTLKLLQRHNETRSAEATLAAYFAVFPSGAETFAPLYRSLAAKKRSLDFSEPLPDLLAKLETFVSAFEAEFRRVFEKTASRHLIFRHAATALNGGGRFQGRIDPRVLPIASADVAALQAACDELKPACAFSSPLTRARESLRPLGVGPPTIDARLAEIDYGRVDGLTFAEARERFPATFAALDRGDEPAFPGGEATDDVLRRLESFVRERWTASSPPSVVCSHNVVLRCLVGSTLGVPKRDWYRLRVPHLGPIFVIATREHGVFVDLPVAVERELFSEWAKDAPRAERPSMLSTGGANAELHPGAVCNS